MNRLVPLVALALSSGLPGYAQRVLEGVGESIHLPTGDMAILEAREERKDLDCRVDAVDPVLGFDLRFHAGYEMAIPLKELSGDGNTLNVVFRVVPESAPETAFYFQQRFDVPMLPDNAKGETTLSGAFDLGEGRYKVDWMVHDRSARVCAHFWDAKAELSGREREIQMAIAANQAEAVRRNQFFEEPPAPRQNGQLLNVKLLVNFAPQSQESFAMRPSDTVALVMMLRRISQDPRVGFFSLVAFNVQEQRILYRQSSGGSIDFPALGHAIEDVTPGLADAKLLVNKKGEAEFLAGLVKAELEVPEPPDALIFLGPKYAVEGSPTEDLKTVEVRSFPVFYLNYNSDVKNYPWRDAVGQVIRVFNGKEYSISRPREMWSAVTEVIDRIVELKKGATPLR